MEIQGLEHAKAIKAGHLHIQEYEVGPVARYAVNRFNTRGGVRQNSEVRLAFQKPPDLEARRTLVVYYQGTYLCHRSGHEWNLKVR